ncbi:MAG: LamB/YcsF family protein [Pseudonocardiaceae bacterium]
MSERSSGLDLNADLGEGFGIWTLGDDDALLDIVTSANVACGFHAGDPSTMRRVCGRAAAAGVVVGAQVSYRDLAGFGRRFVDVEPGVLADEVLYQVGALDACARAAGTRVAYVKPHGALYNATVHHRGQAGAVVDGARAFGVLPVLGLPGSALLASAETAGLPAVPEAFADRGYTPSGELVPRGEPGDLLATTDEVVVRALRLAERGEVVAVDGTAVEVAARSLCLHGDTPGAVEHARAVRAALDAAGLAPTPFC